MRLKGFFETLPEGIVFVFVLVFAGRGSVIVCFGFPSNQETKIWQPLVGGLDWFQPRAIVEGKWDATSESPNHPYDELEGADRSSQKRLPEKTAPGPGYLCQRGQHRRGFANPARLGQKQWGFKGGTFFSASFFGESNR